MRLADGTRTTDKITIQTEIESRHEALWSTVPTNPIEDALEGRTALQQVGNQAATGTSKKKRHSERLGNNTGTHHGIESENHQRSQHTNANLQMG